MQEEKEYLEAYDKYGAQIMRHISFRISGNKEAEDIFQETFFRAWKYIAQGKKIDSLKTFLYTIAKNLIADHYRQKSKNNISLEDLGAKEPSSNEMAGETSDRVDYETTKDAIRSLKEDEREIAYLRYVDDLSITEIAELTGKTPNNVRVISHRAIKNLKGKLYV